MPELEELLEASAAHHKHLCPRQVLGVRMGLLGSKRLGLEVPREDKRLIVFMETDGCAADGVSVSTGSWVGRRTMRIVDFGKVAATLVDSESGRAYRVYPHPRSRARAADAVPHARSRWHGQLKAYQVLPDDELLCVQAVVLDVDLDVIISRAGVRTVCDNCGEEIINEREVLAGDRTLCRGCTGESYYSLKTEDPFEQRYPVESQSSPILQA